MKHIVALKVQILIQISPRLQNIGTKAQKFIKSKFNKLSLAAWSLHLQYSMQSIKREETKRHNNEKPLPQNMINGGKYSTFRFSCPFVSIFYVCVSDIFLKENYFLIDIDWDSELGKERSKFFFLLENLFDFGYYFNFSSENCSDWIY